jgi:hypothetical protein
VEVESSKRNNRQQLAPGTRQALTTIDRLSGMPISCLAFEKAGAGFVAADMPIANRLTVGIMAKVAEQERRTISKCTIEACGVGLGSKPRKIIGSSHLDQ